MRRGLECEGVPSTWRYKHIAWRVINDFADRRALVKEKMFGNALQVRNLRRDHGSWGR